MSGKLGTWGDELTWLPWIEISASGNFSDMICFSYMLDVDMMVLSRFNEDITRPLTNPRLLGTWYDDSYVPF